MTETATPQTGDELEELFHDGPRLKATLEDGSFPGLVKNYVAKFTANNDETVKQFSEQLQLGMQQFRQDAEAEGYRPAAGFRPGAGPALTGRDARRAKAIANSIRPDAARQVEKNGLFNSRAIGAELDDAEYGASLGRFFHTCYVAEQMAFKAGDTDQVNRIQAFKGQIAGTLKNAASSERVPSEGGFLVPENLRSELLMLALESAVIRPRARVIPMDSLRVPIPAIDDTSHTANVFGGVSAYWTEEGAALTASAPSFARVVLDAKKLTLYTQIPNELLQDSVEPLDMWFRAFFPEALAWFEDVGFISGTGVGEPQGFTVAPAAIKINSQTANQVDWQDIAKMYARMYPPSLNKAIWLCAPDVLPSLLQMAMVDQQTGTAVAPGLFLQGFQGAGTPGSGTGDGVHYTLMGRPLVISEKMPSALTGNTTTSGALSFVDLSKYLLGDRQTMQISTSDQYQFQNDMMAYRIIERLDGRVWPQSPVTPQNGSASTLSPFVLLDTPHA
jgi:HK97 family phage major capsid protein